MQIVIDIPEEKYAWIMNHLTLDLNFRECKITSLSTHDRLVDATVVANSIEAARYELSCEYEEGLHEAWEIVNSELAVPTVIPATETKEPTRTMLDCYKCKNNKADISCAECHFELATEEKNSEKVIGTNVCSFTDKVCIGKDCRICDINNQTAMEEEKLCTNCKWYGFRFGCPAHCAQATKIAWESATKAGDGE